MRSSLNRLLLTSILGPAVFMFIYLSVQNPTLISDISASIRTAPGWKESSLNSPLPTGVLSIHNGCASSDLYAIFGASIFTFAANPPGLYQSKDTGETWSLIQDLQSYDLPFADLRVLCGDNSEFVLIRSENIFLRIDTVNNSLVNLSLTESVSPETIIFLKGDHWDKNIVYAATRPSGLWVSSDYGLTWKKVTTPAEDATVVRVALDYHQPSNWFVGTTAGLYKSSDRGLTWSLTGIGLPISADRPISQIAWDPVNPDHGYVIIGSRSNSETLFVESMDNGASWILAGEAPENYPGIPYILVDNESIIGFTHSNLYRRMNGSMLWENIDIPDLGVGVEVASLHIHPVTRDLLLQTTKGFTNGLLISKDNGLSWTVLIGIVDPSISSISANNLYYAGSNQGILFSGDGGASWISRNNGLISENISVVKVHPRQPELVFAGTMDGRIFRSADSGRNWSLVWEGAEQINLFLMIEQFPDKLYAANGAGELMISGDLGFTWRSVVLPLAGHITAGALSAEKILIVINQSELWQSLDMGKTWIRVAIDYPYSRIDDIAVKPGSLFAIVDGSTLIRSYAGTNWQRTTAQPVQSGMQEIIIRYEDSPIIYVKTSDGVYFSESDGTAWQLALRDSASSIDTVTIDHADGIIIAIADLKMFIGEKENIKNVQRENLKKLFFGWETAADQVILLSQYMRVTLVTTLSILGILLFCLFLLILNFPYFLSFIRNTVEIFLAPARSIDRVITSTFVDGLTHHFFFVVWSCAICFSIFYFSFWLSTPFAATDLADMSIFKFFTSEHLGLFSAAAWHSWHWAFFFTATLLFVLMLLYSISYSLALRFLFGSDVNLGLIFNQSFSFTCLVVSAWINLLIILSLAFNFASFQNLLWIVSAIWFGIINTRFIYQSTPLDADEALIAFTCTLFLPLIGIAALSIFAYGYLRKWPWKDALRLLAEPIFHFRTIAANARQEAENTTYANRYLLAYAISIAPIFAFAYLSKGTVIHSPLYNLWHDVWAVWLFPPLFATLAEIFAQWFNSNEFPTRHKKPTQIFGWKGANIALIIVFAAINFWARCLGLLTLLAFDDPTTKWGIEAIYSLVVVARFVLIVFVINQVYPNLVRIAANRIAIRTRALVSIPQIGDHWNFIKRTFKNPSDVLSYADERPGGSKPMNVFLFSIILVILSIFIDLLRRLGMEPSVSDILILPHRLFVILLISCLTFVTALIYSYLFLVDLLKENRRLSLFDSRGNLQILPGYVQVVELTLFVIGLFTIMSAIIAFIIAPGVGRSGVIYLIWAGFFIYSSLVFAGIGNITLEDFTFSRLFFRSIFQAMAIGLWSALVWISRSRNSAISNPISIILEWQEMLLIKAQADVYFSRMGKHEKARILYGSILEKSKMLKPLDFNAWNLPKDIMQRFYLQFTILPTPERATNPLPLQALITSTLINLSTLNISEALNYINESMDDDAPGTWERLSDCREGAVYALAQILMDNKELVVQSIASLIPRNVPSQVIYEISELLPDKTLSSLYLTFGKLVSYSA